MARLTVREHRLYSGGAPFLPQGFTLRTLLPCDSASQAAWTPELRAFFQSIGVNTLRFQVMQDRVAGGDTSYIDQVHTVIGEARTDGFIVLLSCQSEHCGQTHLQLPTRETLTFWTTLAPDYIDDEGVAFDLYNEPYGLPNTHAGWRQWKHGGTGPVKGRRWVGHQALVDHIRELGAGNVVFAEGIAWAHTLRGAYPLSDPLRRYGFELHVPHPPYDRDNWDRRLGTPQDRLNVPIVVGEYQYGKRYVGTPVEEGAQEFLRYCRRHDVGVLGWSALLTEETIKNNTTWIPGFLRWMRTNRKRSSS